LRSGWCSGNAFSGVVQRSSARTPHAGVQYLMGWARGSAKRDGRYMEAALAVYMAETAANWPLFLYTLAVRRIRCYCCSFGGDGVARSTGTDRHRHCNSWGSSQRQTGESLRLSLLTLASLLVCLVEALAALPRAAWPVMCFCRCDMWICACPQNLCELISSAGEQTRAWPAPAAWAQARLAVLAEQQSIR
jgi:hypothetical protein